MNHPMPPVLVAVVTYITVGTLTFLALAAGADPAGIVATWWPVVGMLLPFVIAAATKAGAESHVHKAVAVGFALAAAVVTALGQDWSEVTVSVVATRFVLLWGIAEATYRTVDGLVRARTLDRGLNELTGFAPERGIG